MNDGSRWPTSGIDIACKTEGATMLGPGPINNRGGGVNLEICMGARIGRALDIDNNFA